MGRVLGRGLVGSARDRQGAPGSARERCEHGRAPYGTRRNLATSTGERQGKPMNALGSAGERQGTGGMAARTHSIRSVLIFQEIMVRTFPFMQWSAMSANQASKTPYSHSKKND